MKFSRSILALSVAGLSLALPSSLVHLYRRALSWVDTGYERSASAKCSDTQLQWIDQFQQDSRDLASAASTALGFLELMFGENPSAWLAVPQKDRDRIPETYYTFFGMFDDDDDNYQQAELDRIGYLRRLLAPISVAEPQDYPPDLRVACDSSMLQETNHENQDVFTVKPNLPPPPSEKVYKWDDDGRPEEDFQQWDEWNVCEVGGDKYPAYTAGWTTKREDRMVLCPAFWTGSASVLHQVAVSDGTNLADFTRVGSKIFYHELFHAVSVTGEVWGDPNKMGDIEGLNSYGPWNANRIANADRNRALKNVENLVWFSIAMWQSDWNWSTGFAVRAE